MLAALNLNITFEKSGYASNGSDSTDTPPGAPSRSVRGKKIIKLSEEHHHFINNLPSYAGFVGRPKLLYCPCSAGLQERRDKIKCDWDNFTPCRGSYADPPSLTRHCMKVGGVFHMAFVTYVDELGELAKSEELAKAEEQDQDRLARAAAEEEQSDHFEKKDSPEEEVPHFVLAQDARLASYTNELEAYVQRCVKYMQTISDFVQAGAYR